MLSWYRESFLIYFCLIFLLQTGVKKISSSFSTDHLLPSLILNATSVSKSKPSFSDAVDKNCTRNHRYFINMNRMLASLVLLFVRSALSTNLVTRTQYTQVHGDAEYQPTTVLVLLGTVSGVSSVKKCAVQCVADYRCVTAVYYSDLQTCRLFCEKSTKGTQITLHAASIISLADRSRFRLNLSQIVLGT
jgi:hypothetical protein